MDPTKKRKMEETGADPDAFNPLMLTVDDARRILDSLTHDQLLEIVQNALLRHPDVLDAVRSLADRDTAQRKLFIRGLGWETTTEKLRALFSSYGELDEAVVILDKVTGKSKGYGFITFKHIDGAIMALKDPSKKIDGRMTVTQLAAAGISGGGGPAAGGGGGGGGGVNNPVDVSMRKIYVSNVPYDMAAERLLQHFSMYGEIEEGPLGFDKATGKSKGFALFVYKTAEAARASLVDPVKSIDGHQLNCKLAIDGKRGKPPGVGPMGVQGGNMGNGDGVGAPPSGGHYGGPGGVGGHYGGFSGGLGTGVGGPGLSSIGSQAAGSNLGVNGGYGSGMGGPYGGGSHVGTGYGYGGSGGALGGAGSGVGSGAGLGGVGGGGFSGHGAGMGGAGGGAGGTAGGLGGAGRGSSLYGLPPSSGGMVSGDYPPSSHYNLSSGSYQGQHNQIPGALSAPRIPPGGAYQGMPPYY
ncbi:UBP1-associated protein 2C [Salvia miltiorrhiza]|uniref:UBP1-associated protein 2C n=1 Tax=Salvia miltiorrhiza TaxID=226208 RepID=UPI0025AB71BC|nr:UBP1-associated protein 2C [Salvia miltiorrhiza]XP_057795942.1 UBP1-associated protein 2C [Salvia miltiorrhiza]